MILGEDAKPREILAHELQHFVQDKEGWKGRGSNSEYTKFFTEKLAKMAPPEMEQLRRVTGHIEHALKRTDSLRKQLDMLTYTDGSVHDAIELAEIKGLQKELAAWEDDLVELQPKYKKLSEDPRVQTYTKAKQDFERFFGLGPFDMYRREEGEALANLTAQRLSLTPEEREMVPPWLMYGSPDPIFKELQIPFEDELWAGQDPHNFLRSTEMNLDKAKKEQ
jgi:hypothetical protein